MGVSHEDERWEVVRKAAYPYTGVKYDFFILL
jgi:hypothetical protein